MPELVKDEYALYYIYAYDSTTKNWFFVERCGEDRMQKRASSLEYIYGRVKVRKRTIKYEDYYETPEHPDFLYEVKEDGGLTRKRRLDQFSSA